MPVVLGIFVGGRARRFAGRDKSSLPAPDGSGSLLSRQLRIGAELGARCVLVGERNADAVTGPDAPPRLADRPAGVGPIGGLCALLAHAGQHPAIALACDMPHVDAPLLDRLLSAPPAPVVAPRDPDTGKWYPLCARYSPGDTLGQLEAAIAAGERSFQTFFRRLRVAELVLDRDERDQLRDWDRPEDMG